MRNILVLLSLSVLLALPLTTHACPLCKEAIAASDGEEEPSGMNLPAAYNASIYLLIGMPYLLFASFGFLVYRGLKKNAQFMEALRAETDAPR